MVLVPFVGHNITELERLSIGIIKKGEVLSNANKWGAYKHKNKGDAIVQEILS